MSLPTINPTSPLGSVVNKIINHSQVNTLVNSGDIQLVKDGTGTRVKLGDQFRYNPNFYAAYQSEWTASAGYSKNDVVRVSTSETGSVSRGVWICTQDIPDAQVSDALRTQGWTEGCSYVRYSDRNYAPKWPEPTSNKYWELLSLLPVETHICVNGADDIYYVGAIQSSSLST